ADLRVHRAGVDRAFDDRRGLARAKILVRIGREFRFAAGRAEIIWMARVRMAMRRRVRIDLHPAHGIDGVAGRVFVMIPVAVLMGTAHIDALPKYTLGGYIAIMAKSSKAEILRRLGR